MKMNQSNVITTYCLDDVTNSAGLGQSIYVKQLCQEIRDIEKIGLQKLTPEYVSDLENRLVTSQIDFLFDHDNAENYYSQMFANLGIQRGSQVNPHEILPTISYSVDFLIGDNMKHMVIQGVQGGRVFESSGTTNPDGKKKVYYDEISCTILREIMKIVWNYLSGTKPSSKDNILLLMPPETKLGMPFAAFVADLYEGCGMNVHWGADFIHAPQEILDENYHVRKVSMNFRNNVVPNKKRIAKFNIKSKLSKGDCLITGLFPNIMNMIENTKDFKGPKGFFAKVRPKWALYGGGLKKQGIPFAIQEQGQEVIASYLKKVSQVTNFDIDFLLNKYNSQDPKDQQDIDDILVLFGNRTLCNMGIKALNVYAGVDIIPPMWALGSLQEVYGDNFDKAGPNNRINKDIYFYEPGVIVELMDPITGDVIPRTELETPGILMEWNPYNLAHLHAIKSEDLLQWVEIPKTLKNIPAYLQNKGLQFVGRAAGAKGQGVCG